MTDLPVDAFDNAAEFVMLQEGYDQIVAHSDDPGGLTKYGISQRAYPHLEIKSLTKEQALEIYRADYWNKVHGDKLKWPLNLVLFDYAFNSGLTRAVSDLQHVLGVQTDGYLGPITLGKIEASDPTKLAHDLLAKRLQFLGNLGGWKAFGLGWSRRVLALQDLVSRTQVAYNGTANIPW